MHVAISNAGVDEDAVVVVSRNAFLAYSAVLASGRLIVLASGTRHRWVKVHVVIRIEAHVKGVGFWCDETWVHSGGEVEKGVWCKNYSSHHDLSGKRPAWKDVGEVQIFCNGQEQDECDLLSY